MSVNPEDYERDDEYDLAGIAFEEMLELHKENGVYLEYKLDGSTLTAAVLRTEIISPLITKHNMTLYRPLKRSERRIWQDKKKGKKKIGFLSRNNKNPNNYGY
jgi:hypothetical protein